jgi:hypothetical protein
MRRVARWIVASNRATLPLQAVAAGYKKSFKIKYLQYIFFGRRAVQFISTAI